MSELWKILCCTILLVALQGERLFELLMSLNCRVFKVIRALPKKIEAEDDFIIGLQHNRNLTKVE